jgi:hypothetical protein
MIGRHQGHRIDGLGGAQHQSRGQGKQDERHDDGDELEDHVGHCQALGVLLAPIAAIAGRIAPATAPRR